MVDSIETSTFGSFEMKVRTRRPVSIESYLQRLDFEKVSLSQALRDVSMRMGTVEDRQKFEDYLPHPRDSPDRNAEALTLVRILDDFVEDQPQEFSLKFLEIFRTHYPHLREEIEKFSYDSLVRELGSDYLTTESKQVKTICDSLETLKPQVGHAHFFLLWSFMTILALHHEIYQRLVTADVREIEDNHILYKGKDSDDEEEEQTETTTRTLKRTSSEEHLEDSASPTKKPRKEEEKEKDIKSGETLDDFTLEQFKEVASSLKHEYPEDLKTMFTYKGLLDPVNHNDYWDPFYIRILEELSRETLIPSLARGLARVCKRFYTEDFLRNQKINLPELDDPKLKDFIPFFGPLEYQIIHQLPKSST